VKLSLIPIFSFFRMFSYDFIVYAYFTHAAISITESDAVVKLVMYHVPLIPTYIVYFGSFFKLTRFLKHYVSQGSVAMSLRCGGICSDNFYSKFCVESRTERILKID